MRIFALRWPVFGAALALPLLAFLALAISRPSGAAAHPLGNFTVNRYSRIEIYSDAIRVRYVLDMAEIPTFQEMETIDVDGDGESSPQENEVYLSKKAIDIVDNLLLTVNGSPAELRVLTHEIAYPEGQAGLHTLRLNLLLASPVSGSTALIEYRDDNYSDRIGWKEIVVQPADGVSLSHSSASSEDVSHELTAYPADLLSSPLNVTAATLAYAPGSGTPAPAVSADASVSTPEKAPARAGSSFASLINTSNLTLPVLLLSLLLALAFGAIHALEPGHGKTFVAAYFVGVKGTARQAMSLGLIIAVTHTIGVLALGVITLFGSRFILPEQLYPWLRLASALMILALGVRLMAGRVGGRSLLWLWLKLRGENASHETQDHEHGRSHSHGHSHDAGRDGPPPWRSLVALGLADGLTPSPSALVVLLAAVSLDRIGLGLLLIVAFSMGLAAVLTLVCLGLIYARRFIDWMSARKDSLEGKPYLNWLAGGMSADGALMRIAPVGGAVALMTVGLMLTIRALSQQQLFF